MRSIAKDNPLLQGIIDRVDFNATTHSQRDIDDDRLANLIEAISTKRLGLDDVEADIIGKSYEYLIRMFAEGGGESAGEFYTPPEVGTIMSKVLQPEPGMESYDPCCGSWGNPLLSISMGLRPPHPDFFPSGGFISYVCTQNSYSATDQSPETDSL